MRCSRPLPEAHPELLIIETPGLGREYRVENGPLSCGQRGRVANRFPWITGFDAFAVILVGLLWTSVRRNAVLTIGTGIGLVLLVYQKATRVLWESVLVLPSYGIQLETHRGLPSLPLFVSRKFIPLSEVKDVLINEGLRRWDVRYYLAVLYCPQPAEQRLEVAYENIIPRFPVLIEVYNGVHECLHSK
ncbi:GPI-GlcNAc transferase complex, PIG-H component-domain-containing protein [Lactarius indigo]|nr:GPI-GlcNAc transferase complex, PIG-H component-domain-containing protein [Lactarius indigo]